jgi:hypothetical protein
MNRKNVLLPVALTTIFPGHERRSIISLWKIIASAVAVTFTATAAQAGILTLTSDGISDGFTLSQFAYLNTGYENTRRSGPFGVAYAGNGKVIVSNVPNNTLYVFDDIDGQTIASALSTISGAGTGTTGMASLGGVAYGRDPATRQFAAYNPDGTINHVLSGVTGTTYLGMAGNSKRNTIIATSSSGLIEIDPNANGGLGSSRLIARVNGDGVSVSADGKTAYLEDNRHIVGFDIATGATVLSSTSISGLDGTGVISGGALDGDIVAISNFGFVDLYDPNTDTLSTIASGGSRGDYGMNDPSTGTLLMDFSEGIYRLNCGGGCSIGGSGPPTVPEPESWATMLVGFCGIGMAMRRLRNQTANIAESTDHAELLA